MLLRRKIMPKFKFFWFSWTNAVHKLKEKNLQLLFKLTVSVQVGFKLFYQY